MRWPFVITICLPGVQSRTPLSQRHALHPVVDASNFGQSLHRDLDFADLFATELFLDDS